MQDAGGGSGSGGDGGGVLLCLQRNHTESTQQHGKNINQAQTFMQTGGDHKTSVQHKVGLH